MPDARDVDVTARTAWAEARGDDDPATPDIGEGMEAVTCVVVNRAALAALWVWRHEYPHPLYADGTLAGACQQAWQFSCWNPNDPNRPKLLAVTAEVDHHFALALAIAERAVDGTLVDVTHRATHYHTIRPPDLSKPWPPEWTHGRAETYRTPRHVFYDLGMSG
jgi:N-acetylmuramoyl-L-alanine amidase